MPLLSIRLPEQLVSSLDKLRGSRSRSEIIRSALDEQIQDERQKTLALTVDPQRTFQDIIIKRDNRLLLSHAEIEFLAIRVHETYMLAKTPIVTASSINEVMNAFIQLRSLLDPNDLEHHDRYFMGNLGVHKNSIWEAIDESIIKEKKYTNSSHCEFKSRNFEVITRDIKHINLKEVNRVLEPHIETIISIACRSFWCKEEACEDFLKDRVNTINEFGEHANFRAEGIVLSCMANEKGDLSGVLLLESQNVWICLNSFFEIEELNILIRLYTEEEGKPRGERGNIFSILTQSKQEATISAKNFRIIVQEGVLKYMIYVFSELQSWHCYQESQKRFGCI